MGRRRRRGLPSRAANPRQYPCTSKAAFCAGRVLAPITRTSPMDDEALQRSAVRWERPMHSCRGDEGEGGIRWRVKDVESFALARARDGADEAPRSPGKLSVDGFAHALDASAGVAHAGLGER